MVNNRIWHWSLVITVWVCGVGGTLLSVAQGQEGSKGIESKEVVERPVTLPPLRSSSSKPPVKRSNRRVTYRSSKPFRKSRPGPGYEYAKVGVTIWRLKGDGSKDLRQLGEEAQTLEQVEVSTQLAIGSNVRLGIEPLTRDGYLYVIDREQFADGSYGTPHLIFPTLRTRKGNNLVRAFERVLIPRRPSYFRINRSSTGKAQIAEVLTIIISPTELELPVPLSDKPMTLRAEQLKEWEAKWSGPVIELEMEDGAGETTGAKDLGHVGEESQRLTEDDPLPQTVYRGTVKRGSPLLVTVPLRFEAPQRLGGKAGQ
jgi:hypothetical protein